LAIIRFGDPRVMAVLGTLVGFCHVAVGFTNRDLTQLVGALWRGPYTSRQATYDLRRLIRKELIVKIPPRAGTNSRPLVVAWRRSLPRPAAACSRQASAP
jgi:hypothetical protein